MLLTHCTITTTSTSRECEEDESAAGTANIKEFFVGTVRYYYDCGSCTTLVVYIVYTILYTIYYTILYYTVYCTDIYYLFIYHFEVLVFVRTVLTLSVCDINPFSYHLYCNIGTNSSGSKKAKRSHYFTQRKLKHIGMEDLLQDK